MYYSNIIYIVSEPVLSLYYTIFLSELITNRRACVDAAAGPAAVREVRTDRRDGIYAYDFIYIYIYKVEYSSFTTLSFINILSVRTYTQSISFIKHYYRTRAETAGLIHVVQSNSNWTATSLFIIFPVLYRRSRSRSLDLRERSERHTRRRGLPPLWVGKGGGQ